MEKLAEIPVQPIELAERIYTIKNRLSENKEVNEMIKLKVLKLDGREQIVDKEANAKCVSPQSVLQELDLIIDYCNHVLEQSNSINRRLESLVGN